MKIRLALVAGSPVYYQAPLYRRIAGDPHIELTAIFASTAGALRPFENGFGTPVDFGVDALEGYSSRFLKKAGSNPSGGSTFDLHDRDVVAAVWRGRYDVLWLHGYHTMTHVLAAVAQKARGGAILYREEQTLLNPRPRWKTALKHVGLPWLFQGSYGLFIGIENRRWFERWGMPPERLFPVPYAVDNEALQRAAFELAPRRERLRMELGVRRDAGPVILMVGRLIPKKQPMHMLEAYRRVRASRPCSLLVVGSGPLEDALRRKVAVEEIPDVVFAGFRSQTEIARAYAAADIFALVSSHDETWGLVVNEAMNFRLPIVASDRVGSTSDLVRSGQNGFVVPHDDLDALVAVLNRLIESSDLRERFGDASLAMILPRTYDVAAAGLVTAVRAAVGESRWMLAEASAMTSVAPQNPDKEHPSVDMISMEPLR